MSQHESDTQVENDETEHDLEDTLVPIYPGSYMPGRVVTLKEIRDMDRREEERRRKRYQQKANKPPKQEVSPLAKAAWTGVGLLAAIVGPLEIIKHIPQYRRPTQIEETQMDKILRPAAVHAARVAVRAYNENPSTGSMYKPYDIKLLPVENAVELDVAKNGYEIIVDLQKHNGQLDPETAYEVSIGDNILNNGGIQISRVVYPTQNNPGYSLDKDFLFAGDGTEKTTADLISTVTDSSAQQQIKEARKLAAEVENEIAIFEHGA